MSEAKFHDFRLQTPFTAVITGGSKTGKTTLCTKLLEHRDKLFTTVPAHTVYFYGADQPDLFSRLEKNGLVQEFIEGRT